MVYQRDIQYPRICSQQWLRIIEASCVVPPPTRENNADDRSKQEIRRRAKSVQPERAIMFCLSRVGLSGG